jgi:DNA-binding NtrC family response regulator/tetratricopeptide (TPR) repeat protein
VAPNDLAGPTGLMKRGRFLEVIASLRQYALPRHDPLHERHQVLLGDALQLTGNNEEAERLSHELVSKRGVASLTLATCHVILGNISRDRGNAADCFQHFEKALALARTTQDRDVTSSVSLRLMAHAAEDNGTDIAAGMMPDVRRQITQSGDPIALASLHLLLAKLEGKRGLTFTATRHLQAGKSILRKHENVSLEGSAEIDEACLAFLASDIDGAFEHASSALRSAAVSGHAATHRAACANLAHIHLSKGEFQQAEHYFNDALARCEQGGTHEVALLDGLAQLELARGEFEQSEQFLDKIERMARRSSIQPNYYHAWSFRTRLQLLKKQGRITNAIDFLKQIQPCVDGFHPSLRLTLKALQAELFCLAGNAEAATVAITLACKEYNGGSIEVLAEIERTLGKMLAVDNPALATEHVERAIRILSIVRNVNARTEVVADCADVLSGRGEARNVAVNRELSDEARTGRCLDRVKAMIDFCGSPELLGYEVFELLKELTCACTLTLVARSKNCEPDVLARWSDRAIGGLEANEETLSLGSARGREFAVLLVPKADLAAQVACRAVRKTVQTVTELEALRRDVNERSAIWPADEFTTYDGAVFAAEPMVDILKTIRKIASSNVTVLLTGETGTGKEVLARALHHGSARADKPFLPFNCAAVPRDLVESQLFGHRRGAFSGAHDHFDGIIRSAAGGTLFLDEIGELSLEVQPKLLRFLESNEIHPLGEPRPIRVDIRLVAASNAKLDQLVAQGLFREDLFYRLNVIRFKVPALRERREEIPQLAHHFLKRYSAEHAKPDLSIAQETMEYLLLYEWPGNVRQLANEIKRFVALAENRAVFLPEHLSPEIAASRQTIPSSVRTGGHSEVVIRLDQPLGAAVEQLERSMLEHTLKASGWHVESAAKMLGLSRKGLYLKRQRLRLSSPNSGPPNSPFS